MTDSTRVGSMVQLNRWKTQLCMVAAAFAVVALCILVRTVWGPDPASAEGPTAARAETTAARRPATQNTPAVVALVNGESISRQDLSRECLRRFGDKVLQSLVNKQLILDACHQRGIVITAQDVEDEVHRMAKNFNLPTERWMELLENERNIQAQQYRNDIIWPTIALKHLAEDRLTVSDEELRKEFESFYGPKVKVRMIAVTQHEKAEHLHAQAVADTGQFASLAMENSEDVNSAPYGGLIPPIRRHAGDPALEKVAFGLKEGEISPVLHIANQYVILRCEGHLPETYIPPEHKKSVVHSVEERIRSRKLRAAAADTFRQLQDAAQVVNVYNDPELSKVHPGVAAMVNGQQLTVRQLAEECVVRHGIAVLEQEIHRRLLEQELRHRQIAVTEPDIDQEIIRAAKSYGFTNQRGETDVDGWLKMVTENQGLTVDHYLKNLVWPSVALKKLVGNQVQVDDEDLQRGFESNYGQRVQCLTIVMSDQRRASEVWELARKTPTEEFFRQLATQYSVEPISQNNQGEIPPIRRFGGQPAVEKEAFQLQPGQMSGIIVMGDKHIILRCLGRTTPVVTELADVRDLLFEDLHEKKLRVAMAKAYNQLKNSAQIDNYLANRTQSGSPRRDSPPQSGPVNPPVTRTPDPQPKK